MGFAHVQPRSARLFLYSGAMHHPHMLRHVSSRPQSEKERYAGGPVTVQRLQVRGQAIDGCLNSQSEFHGRPWDRQVSPISERKCLHAANRLFSDMQRLMRFDSDQL
jgi:hypothetical protein